MKTVPQQFSFPPNRHNNGCEYRERLGSATSSKTLLAYLCERYDHSSPAEWAARIASGQVLIDSFQVDPETPLHEGSELVWQRPPWIEPAAPLSFSILYEDEDILAVDKPAGLPTLPGANFLTSTLLHLVRSYSPDASPVHRLGRWTSGLVLFAKNRNARTALTRQFAARTVKKRYRAIASGVPEWKEKLISAPIGPVAHPLLGTIHAATPKGRTSLSRVDVLEPRRGSCLCDVHISTGRPHQIRIHLAYAGHPLVGDPLYTAGGMPSPDSPALPGDPGYHLHSAEISFLHPGSGRVCTLQSEPDFLFQPSTAIIAAELLP
jgi:23S rRNA pseudouridine1911/1915/1917 synthase